MIEALFRSLKHRWLFMNSLTTFESVKESVSKYLNDHNYRIPHHALKGAVPIEIYTGKDSNTLNSLFLQLTNLAKIDRMESNLNSRCISCPT
jgi:hypothetical protein